MPVREIPRDDWVMFLESFSRLHDGWLITIDVLGAPDERLKARESALKSITADLRNQGEDSISILARDTPHDEVTHIIKAPSHVRLMEMETGAHEGLQIESKSGQTAIVRFRSPMLPELVDGIVLE